MEHIEVASILSAWRSRLGFSQRRAAEELSIPFETYRSYEQRRRTAPSTIVAEIEAIEARVTGVARNLRQSHIHIFGGGTVSHVRSHLAICATAYGTTARQIEQILKERGEEPTMHLTRMADLKSRLETNVDVGERLDQVIADPNARIIFFNPAMVDFSGQIGEIDSGRKASRLKTKAGQVTMTMTPTEKVVARVRRTRKDLFVVAFKTTAGATPDEQYLAGLDLLKKNSLNLVMANDVVTRLNMVIVPEEARYHETTDRNEALQGLVEMAMLRSTNTFTRSEVIPGDSVPWNSDLVPENLRAVVNHCIARGAYKPFHDKTVGHFAARVDDTRIVTSKRKHNFNRLPDEGMVLIESTGPDTVIAHGYKPSVGGMSQRIIFNDHQDTDCIVHFHCPLRPESKNLIPHRDQRPYECGSHQCGQTTSDGLKSFGPIKAIMLDEHGPNIVFNRNVPAADVIAFIETHFDLTQKTGGAVA